MPGEGGDAFRKVAVSKGTGDQVRRLCLILFRGLSKVRQFSWENEVMDGVDNGFVYLYLTWLPLRASGYASNWARPLSAIFWRG